MCKSKLVLIYRPWMDGWLSWLSKQSAVQDCYVTRTTVVSCSNIHVSHTSFLFQILIYSVRCLVQMDILVCKRRTKVIVTGHVFWLQNMSKMLLQGSAPDLAGTLQRFPDSPTGFGVGGEGVGRDRRKRERRKEKGGREGKGMVASLAQSDELDAPMI